MSAWQSVLVVLSLFAASALAFAPSNIQIRHCLWVQPSGSSSPTSNTQIAPAVRRPAIMLRSGKRGKLHPAMTAATSSATGMPNLPAAVLLSRTRNTTHCALQLHEDLRTPLKRRSMTSFSPMSQISHATRCPLPRRCHPWWCSTLTQLSGHRSCTNCASSQDTRTHQVLFFCVCSFSQLSQMLCSFIIEDMIMTLGIPKVLDRSRTRM